MAAYKTVIDEGKEMNPWRSIWFRPQKTIASIVKKDPERLVPDLAVFGGVISALNGAFESKLGDNYGVIGIVFVSICFGAIFGLLALYIFSALIHWTGKWLNGKAPIEHIRSALSWSNVPIIWTLIFWIIAIAIFQKELFQSDIPTIKSHFFLAFIYAIFFLWLIVVQWWTFLIFLRCLGQVQNFSIWKSILNVILPFVIIFIPLAGVVIISRFF